ncbi:hypothetical protein D3C76_1439710 [compost metagenome]
MLPGLKQRQPDVVGWLHIYRTDVLAFRFDPHHPQRPPLITQGLGLQARLGLLPCSRQQTGRRNTVKAPAQTEGSGTTNNVFHVEHPQTFSTLKCLYLRAFKDDFGAPT